jgi:uncharacterized protein YecT (DUF1311 family)
LQLLPVAAEAGSKLDCNNAMNQNDMNICASGDYKVSDAKLNTVWRMLLGKLDENEKTQIREAQKAWISYRDAECKFTVRQNEGSIYPTVWYGCLNEQTNRRTKELMAHLDCVNGKDSCTE